MVSPAEAEHTWVTKKSSRSPSSYLGNPYLSSGWTALPSGAGKRHRGVAGPGFGQFVSAGQQDRRRRHPGDRRQVRDFPTPLNVVNDQDLPTFGIIRWGTGDLPARPAGTCAGGCRPIII